jgi:hypothetical protein
MKRKLQVLINNQWEYVFCHNGLQSNPITTKDRLKAVPFNSLSLAYFEMKHSEHEFKSSSN